MTHQDIVPARNSTDWMPCLDLLWTGCSAMRGGHQLVLWDVKNAFICIYIYIFFVPCTQGKYLSEYLMTAAHDQEARVRRRPRQAQGDPGCRPERPAGPAADWEAAAGGRGKMSRPRCRRERPTAGRGPAPPLPAQEDSAGP